MALRGPGEEMTRPTTEDQLPMDQQVRLKFPLNLVYW